MRLSDLDYELPEALIAQEPTAVRDGARLLHLLRDVGEIQHRQILDLPELIRPSLWVVNNTRVIPARLYGQKKTGGKVEVLLLERQGRPGMCELWSALGKSSKSLREGLAFTLSEGRIRVEVQGRNAEGELQLRLEADEPIGDVLQQTGHIPLPPYIRRSDVAEDRERYQTIFAKEEGAVAAPTAGLHFSERLKQALEARGHAFASVTLHVGAGTFRPVSAESLDAHRMHEERYHVSAETIEAIASARAQNMPIVAVGTTVVRTLESCVGEDGRLKIGAGRTRLFIRPPYAFKVVDALLTNFHLPRSTLIALVMAFAGMDATREAYRAAVEARYRFFSYGDAMFIANKQVNA